MDEQIRLSQEAQKLNECKKIPLLNKKLKIIEKIKKKKRKKKKKKNRKKRINQRKKKRKKEMKI